MSIPRPSSSSTSRGSSSQRSAPPVTLEAALAAELDKVVARPDATRCRWRTDEGDMCFRGRGDREQARLVGDPPDDLIISLKRFDWGVGGSKLSDRVVVPARARIFETEYELEAFMDHTGSSLVDGHYVFYVLRDGTWYAIDDRRVIPDPPGRPARQDMAYVYHFRRRASSDPTLLM